MTSHTHTVQICLNFDAHIIKKAIIEQIEDQISECMFMVVQNHD